MQEIGLDEWHEITGIPYAADRSSLEFLLILHAVFQRHLLVSKLFSQDDVLITQRRLSILLLVHKKWLLFGDLGFIGVSLSYLVCNLIAGIFLHSQIWLRGLLERLTSNRIRLEIFHRSFLRGDLFQALSFAHIKSKFLREILLSMSFTSLG